MEFPLKSQRKDIEMKSWLPGCAWTSPSDVTCLLCNSAKRLTLPHFLGSFHSSQSSNDCFFYSMTWTRCLCFGFPCVCLKSLGLYTLLWHPTPTFQKSLFSFSSLMTQEAPAQSSLSGTEDITDRNSGLRNTETRYAGLHKDWWRPILADLPDCWSPWFQILSFAQPSACLLSPRSQVCSQSLWAPQPWRALTPLENAQLPSLSFGGF